MDPLQGRQGSYQMFLTHSYLVAGIQKVVQETHQKRRSVTLEPAKAGVIGSHGVSVQHLVEED